MLVLGIDTSATTAACAVLDSEQKRILVSGAINKKLTHSQTLMPLMDGLLKSADISFEDIDAFAITNGPGSFTGLRIGISAVKGMAFALNKPCIAISTLEALAYNLLGQDCIACSVMDARCNQVYNAMFLIENNKITRLCEDRALFIEELQSDLENYDSKIIFVGDGAELVYSRIKGDNYQLAETAVRFQSGTSVCLAALNNKEISAKELMPSYLRLPQAERERLAKLNS